MESYQLKVFDVEPTKLYSASSRLNNFEGYNDVPCHWLVIGRASWIYDYGDWLFTKQEIEAFRVYMLLRFNEVIRITEEEIPTAEIDGPDILGIGKLQKYWYLDEEEGYGLEFKVWGYYDLEVAIPTLMDEGSLKFAQTLLQKLGYLLPKNLEETTRDIFYQDRLYAIYPQDEIEAYQIEQFHDSLTMFTMRVDENNNLVSIQGGKEEAEDMAFEKQIQEADNLEELLNGKRSSEWVYLANLEKAIRYGELLLSRLGLETQSLRDAIEHVQQKTKLIVKQWGEDSQRSKGQ